LLDSQVKWVREMAVCIFAKISIPQRFYVAKVNESCSSEFFESLSTHITVTDPDLKALLVSSVETPEIVLTHGHLVCLTAFLDRSFFNKTEMSSLASAFVRRCFSDQKFDCSFDLFPEVCTFVARLGTSELVSRFEEMITSTNFPKWKIDGDSFTLNTDGHVGLTNLGCTCYLNSFLQQFFAVTRFRQLVFDCDSDDAFLERLRKLYIKLQLTDMSAISPDKLVDEWVDPYGESLDRNVQHDAAEFIVSFLDRMEGLVGVKPMNDLFQGRFAVRTMTLDGQIVNESFDKFCVLPVVIENQSSFIGSLAALSDPEFISGYKLDDAVVDVQRTTAIDSLPPRLIIQLTRFRMNFAKGKREKITDPFAFPLELELIETRYRLRGIIIHKGSATSGHYYSYIFTQTEWLCFNDDHVTVVTEAEVIRDGTNDAYILFYWNPKHPDIEPAPPPGTAAKMAQSNADKHRQRVLCSTPFYQMMGKWAQLQSPPHLEVVLRYVFSVLPFCISKLDGARFCDPLFAWFKRNRPPLDLLGELCELNALIACPTDQLRQTVNWLVGEALVMSRSTDLFASAAKLLEECMTRPAYMTTYFDMLGNVLSRSQELRSFAAASEFPDSLQQCITVRFPEWLSKKKKKVQKDNWASANLASLLQVVAKFPIPPELRTFCLKRRWIENVLSSKTDLKAFALFLRAFGDRDSICAQLRQFAEQSDQDDAFAQLIQSFSAAK
jgi:hypothetical protein